MMETEKAIKVIDGKMLEIVLEMQICKSEVQKKRLSEEYDSLMVARSALEKQVPEKLIFLNYDLYDDGAGGVDGEDLEPCYKCPRCNHIEDVIVYLNLRVKYCPHCGQAIRQQHDLFVSRYEV